MARMLTFSVEPNPGTGELEEKIVAAIREWVTGIRDESVMITADGALSDEWAALVRSVVLPQLGVEFIATGARAMPESGVSRDDQLIAWPPGVDGPPTVSGLLAEYPLTFAGVSAAQVTLIIASPTWTTRFAEYLRTTENLVVGMADTVFQDMQQALAKVGQGAPVFEKQQAVREFLSWEGEGGYEGWMRRAERIARTETATARNTAAHTAALDVANAGVPMRKVWSCAHDERTRPAHREADGQARDIAEPFTVGGEPLDHPGDRVHGSAKNTINCVIGSTLVAGPGQNVATGYRRPARGRFIELRLANGSVLTITPNHPVLTDGGYVAAQFLREGDRLMATPNSWSPHVDDMPPRIDEAFDSMSGSGVSRRVSGESLYFHGDASEEEEVEIVSADSKLGDNLNSAFGGYFGEHRFIGLDDTKSVLPGSGPSEGGFETVVSRAAEFSDAFSSSSSISGGGEDSSLSGGEIRHSDPVSLRTGPDRKTFRPEPGYDSGSAASEAARHLQDAYALGMEPVELIGVDSYVASHFVYNLETSRNYYIANGVMIHNCRCVASYIEGEDAQDTIDWLEQFRGRSLADMEAEMDREMQALAASGGEVTALAWEGRLAPLGEPTGDGRVFNADGEFTFRTFPLPLLWQETTGEGHDQSRIVGTIDGGEITDGAITAHGTVFADEERVVSLLERGVVRPSVDLCDMVCEIEDDETGELLRVTSATVMAATLVAKPAFENVGVFLTGDKVDVTPSSLAASATVTLDEYRAASFEDPGLSMPTPVTVTETGRVYGHLALWDSCHIGMPGRCVKPPHSARGYAAFHQSTVHTDKGPLAVGRLTVGGGHASPRAGVRAAAEHYDRTGAAWAMVRAGEDEFGIWVSGQVCPSATREQINAGASAPLSGDWRDIGGNLELVAALSVSTPGFPVRREYTASDGETMSLVAAAEIPAPTDRELSDREVDVLAARVEERITRHRRAENLRHRFGQASERWRERKTRRVMDRAEDVFTARAKEQD